MIRPIKHVVLASIAALTLGAAGSFAITSSASAHAGYHHNDWQTERDGEDNQSDQTSYDDSYKGSEDQDHHDQYMQQTSYDRSSQRDDNNGCDHQQASRSDNNDDHQSDARQASYRYSRDDNDNTASDATDDTNEATNDQYEQDLATNLREHAALAAPLLKAELMKEPDLEALKTAADQNNMAIADLVEQGYPGTHDEFLDQWRNHISYYVEYLNGAKNDDQAQKMQAVEHLKTFVADVTNLLGSASDSLDQEALQQGMTMHGQQTTTLIDNLVAGNYTTAYAVAHEAYLHMGDIAKVLAAGTSGTM
jgi:hypothetical protein